MAARIYSWSADVRADKRVSTTNYLWPSKLSYYCSPHTEEARFVVLLLDEGERVREPEYSSVFVTYYCVCVFKLDCCVFCLAFRFAHSVSHVRALTGMLCIAAGGSHRYTVPESERKRSLSGPLLSGTWSCAGKHLGDQKEQTKHEGGRGRRGRGGEAGWGGELNRERERETEATPKSCRVQEEESCCLHVSVASLRLTCLPRCFVNFRSNTVFMNGMQTISVHRTGHRKSNKGLLPRKLWCNEFLKVLHFRKFRRTDYTMVCCSKYLVTASS